MNITRREDILHLSVNFNLSITHFARGCYHKASGELGALPVNRFLVPIMDPFPGESYVRDKRNTFVMEVGKGYFIPLFHKAGVKLQKDLRFFSVQFHSELFSAIDIFSGLEDIHCFPAAAYLEELQKIYGEEGSLKGLLKLHALIQSFIGDFPYKLPLEENESLRLLERYGKIWKYVLDHPPGAIQVGDLAELYPGRRETFTRHFTRDTGIPPKEYLRKNLLRKACELLGANDLLIKEIAEKLGFTNEYYFSRFFRKHLGVPPLTYRKNRQF